MIHPCPFSSPRSWPAEAPAARLEAFGCQARKELGEHTLGKQTGNASRAAHAFVNRWGLTWKVPFTDFTLENHHGETVVVSYISPKSFVRFLLKNAPEVLTGGVIELDKGQSQLEGFWRNYEAFHPTHRLFQENHAIRSPRNIHWQSVFMEMKVEEKKREILLWSCLNRAWVWELLRISVRNADMMSVMTAP